MDGHVTFWPELHRLPSIDESEETFLLKMGLPESDVPC